MSDVLCRVCGKRIGVHWVFRSLFSVLILLAAAGTGLIVYVDQGLYAALLFVSVPIGALGYIKARFAPLVVRRDLTRDPTAAAATKARQD
jgi:hypothetical protein